MAYGMADNNTTFMSYPAFLSTMNLKDSPEAKTKYEVAKAASQPKATAPKDTTVLTKAPVSTATNTTAAPAKPAEVPEEDRKLTYDEFRKKFSLTDGADAKAKYSEFVKNGGTLRTALSAPGALQTGIPDKAVVVPPEIAKGKLTANPIADIEAAKAKEDADYIAKKQAAGMLPMEKTVSAGSGPAIASTSSTSDFPDYQAYLKMNGLKDTPEEKAKYQSLVLAQPDKSTLSKDKTEAATIPDMGEDKFTTEGTLKRSFWDELARNREALQSMGLNFYDFGSDKATAEQLEKVKAGNPELWKQFIEGNGTLNLQVQKPKEAAQPEVKIDPRFQNNLNQVTEWDKQKPPVKLPTEDVGKVVGEAVKDTGLGKENKKGETEIDWKKVEQIAKDTGMGILAILQGAIGGWLAARQNRMYDVNKENVGAMYFNDQRGIAAEQRRLAQEQELQANEAGLRSKEQEAQTKTRREDAATERAWQLQVLQIQQDVENARTAAERAYQDRVRAETNELKIKEAQKDRDAAIQQATIQGKQAIAQIQARATAETTAATGGVPVDAPGMNIRTGTASPAPKK